MAETVIIYTSLKLAHKDVCGGDKKTETKKEKK
jgi:hypothetical protein